MPTDPTARQVADLIARYTPDDLDSPAVRRLLDLALAPHEADFAAAPPLKTVIKAIAARQRERRPT